MSNPYAPPSPGRRPGRDDRSNDAGGSRPPTTGPQGPRDGAGPDGAGPDGAARGQRQELPPPGGGLHEPGQPSGGPATPQRPPAAPPDPKAVKEANRHALTFGLLMLATLVTFSFPLPWGVAPVGFSLAAVVAGLLAARGLWRAGVRGAPLTMSVLFAVFAGLVSLTLLASLLLYPLRLEFEACLRDAVTIAGTDRCQEQYNDAIIERFSSSARAPTD